MPLELSRMIDDLVGRAWSLARQRSGRLAALRVALPGTTEVDRAADVLAQRLAEAGLPDVEVEVEVNADSARILVVEFERWKA